MSKKGPYRAELDEQLSFFGDFEDDNVSVATSVPTVSKTLTLSKSKEKDKTAVKQPEMPASSFVENREGAIPIPKRYSDVEEEPENDFQGISFATEQNATMMHALLLRIEQEKKQREADHTVGSPMGVHDWRRTGYEGQGRRTNSPKK